MPFPGMKQEKLLANSPLFVCREDKEISHVPTATKPEGKADKFHFRCRKERRKCHFHFSADWMPYFQIGYFYWYY